MDDVVNVFSKEDREIEIRTDLRQKDLDGEKKMRDQEMGKNSTVGTKRQRERWAEMGRHKNRDKQGETKKKRDEVKQNQMEKRQRKSKRDKENERDGERDREGLISVLQEA